MSFNRLNEDNLTNAEKGMVRMKTITNYVMGTLIIACGFMVFFPPKAIAAKLALYDDVAIKMLGVICFIYGGFRIFRGYMKNYFRGS